MDASTFRWVLIGIAAVLALAIYLFGLQQARLRKRDAIETFTREEIDSALVEDELLRVELSNLSTIYEDDDVEEGLGEIQIRPSMDEQETVSTLVDPENFEPSEVVDNEVEESLDEIQKTSAIEEQETVSTLVDPENFEPSEVVDNEVDESLDEIQKDSVIEEQETPSALSGPEIFVPPELADKDEDRYISYHLRHSDFRLIVGEEAESAVQHAGLELNVEGLIEYYQDEELVFQIASLSVPGNFFGIEDLNFVTLGFNCFIDLDSCANPRLAYESMLKKIDELVRVLDARVYKPNDELLTISDVSEIREKLVKFQY